MIINCPKCGFSQPKDRYCANCGVDMEAYKPAEVPLITRILKSWPFQAAILLVAIVTALSFLRVQQQRHAEEGMAAVNQPPAQPPSSQATLEVPPPPPPPAEPTQTPTVQTNISRAAEQLALAPTASSPAPTLSGAAAARARMAARRGGVGDTNRDSVFTQIDLIYAELPRNVFNNLMADSRILEGDGVASGIYPKIAPLLRQMAQTGAQRIPSLRILESARGLPVRINQPIVTFKGMRDPALDRNLGISSQIIPTAMDENGLYFQVEVQRTLRDGAAGLAEFEYRGEFVLPKGEGAFIAGLLPHRQLSAGERALYASGNILKVLTSQEFQQHLSEFVLFIEAR